MVASALLDRLLHHAVVIPIEANSYRLREHANLLPEHLRSRAALKSDTSPMIKYRRDTAASTGSSSIDQRCRVV